MTTIYAIAAVDPGVDGAVAILNLSTRAIYIHSMRTVHTYDNRSAFLAEHHIGQVYVEDIPHVNTAPAPLMIDYGGWLETFAFSQNFGKVVRPSVWQRTCNCPTGLSYSARKRWLNRRAQELFPSVSFGKPHADALLILHHVMTNNPKL